MEYNRQQSARPCKNSNIPATGRTVYLASALLTVPRFRCTCPQLPSLARSHRPPAASECPHQLGQPAGPYITRQGQGPTAPAAQADRERRNDLRYPPRHPHWQKRRYALRLDQAPHPIADLADRKAVLNRPSPLRQTAGRWPAIARRAPPITAHVLYLPPSPSGKIENTVW